MSPASDLNRLKRYLGYDLIGYTSAEYVGLREMLRAFRDGQTVFERGRRLSLPACAAELRLTVGNLRIAVGQAVAELKRVNAEALEASR